MQLKGKVWKDGKAWLVSCQALDAMTQGKSKDDALAMMKDWVWSMLDDNKVPIEIEAKGARGFVMTFPQPGKILSLMLSQLRTRRGLSLSDFAKDLGHKSKNNIHQYETGKHEPSLSKLQEMLSVLGFEIEIELREKKDRCA